jgi:methylmalonyl-CoA/ethylmalonyl-CoA epimerase
VASGVICVWGRAAARPAVSAFFIFESAISKERGDTEMIRRLTHIGHIVKDLDQAIALYTTAFGFKLASSGVKTIPGGKACMVEAGDILVELIQPTDSDHRVGRFLQQRGEGLFHLSFRVDDLNAEVRALREMGIVVEDPRTISTLPSRPRIAFIDPQSVHGVIIELAEESAP